MLSVVFRFLVLCFFSLSAYASSHIVSLTPQKDAVDVPSNIKIKVTFDNPIITSSVRKKAIKLRSGHRRIRGKITIQNNNTLIFTPRKNLKAGKYHVRIEALKLKGDKPIKPRTWFQKLIYKICSLTYKDIRDCRLCRFFFCNNIRIKSIRYSFIVNTNKVYIKSLNLKVSSKELKENTQTDLTLKATYSDNSTKNISQNIEWSIGDNKIVSINNNTLKALREGTTTISAKVEDTTSNEITITVYKEINGYRLPPEPDPKINNSTLLGIDVNHNGVRDDVERYIIKRFENDPEFPKTKTAIAMQYAWSRQKVIENPDHESYYYEADALECAYYWYDKQTAGMSGWDSGQYRMKNKIYTTEMKDKIYNTRERIQRLFDASAASSGHILTGSKKEGVNSCRTNIDELGE